MGFFEGADADSLSRRSVTPRTPTDSVVRSSGEQAPPVAWSATGLPRSSPAATAHTSRPAWTTNGPISPRPTASRAGAEHNRFNGYPRAPRSGREVAAAVARNLA